MALDLGWLLLLQPHDLQGLRLEPFFRTASGTNAAVSLSAQHNVPDDQAFLMDNLQLVATGGGGQTVATMRLFVANPTGNLLARITQRQNITVATDDIDRQGIWLIPPGGIVVGLATFSAGVAANSVDFAVTGWMLPKGNLLRA